MQLLAILFIGYSVVCVLVIALTHFRHINYAGQTLSRVAGIALLLILAGMQLVHYAYLQYDAALIHSPVYRILFFAVAPTFYLFSMPLLQARAGFRLQQVLHFLPAAAAPWLSYYWALPLAFAFGACYLLWLARTVYALRAQRSRFRIELTILAAVFVIATMVFALGLSLPLLGEQRFYQLYASAIGCAFLLVSLVLGMTPQLSVEVAEAAREAYAVSTLTHIDCAAALARLEALMQQECLYQQAMLDLPTLAKQVELSSHQLSELINTRLGKSFSRYLREHRINAARKMLLSEPSASVLSVGLSVGFTSQSNFYDAFREITGMTPGKFRKLHVPMTPE